MTYGFEKEKLTTHLYRIQGTGDVCMYYIKGTAKGLLVDTGYGAGDLKSFIEDEFGQDYIIILTHGHWDHAGGAGQWDEVFMNPLDLILMNECCTMEFRRERLESSLGERLEEDLVPEFTGILRELKEGVCFDLGGVSAELIEVPGHTYGIMAVLIPQERILLLGDACGEFTFMFRKESTGIKIYKNTLVKIRNMSVRFDRILRQHGSFESPMSLIDENIEICEEILNGKDDHIPWKYMDQDVFIAKRIDPKTHKRADGGSGNIVYSLEKIRSLEE